MFLPAKLTPLLFVAITIHATGATPPAPSDALAADQSNSSPISASTRLGIKFSPPNSDSPSATTAPQAAVPRLTDPSLPLTILKPYLVTTPRIKLTEKEVLTDKARLELAKKTQLTPLYRLTFGPLSQLGTYYFNWLSILGGWHPNDLEAMILYRQEEDLRRKAEMNSLVRLESLYDAKDEKLLQRLKPEETTKMRGLHLRAP